MIKNIRHSTSAPEADTGCRMADFNNDIIRRNRLRLRRIRSSPSVSSGEENLQKRKKNGDSKHELVFSTSTKKLSISPESDVILPGTSSYVGGGDETSKGSVEKVTCWSHGSISVIGRRRDMEDAVAIEQGFINKGFRKYDFFGIYDGHGGVRVAHACSERLHEVIIKEVEEEVDEEVIDWEKVMISSFHKMDEEVNKNNGSAVAMMGSTAVVAVVGDEELVVANCGDSRAVVCRDGAAVALSDDHKPERPDELARVEGCGGKVINWNGQRVLGVLATSRSIGDRYLKPFVISEPEVRVMKRTNKDEFLILGSDGLWDVISNDLACEIVKKCLDGQLRRTFKSKDENNSSASNKNSETGAAIAAALLAELAIARGSRDNISVIVVELKRLG